MPVFKYRRVEDMPDAALLVDAGDPRIVRKIRYLWALSSKLCKLYIPRGVRKYRSIEEMSADRDRWESARIQRIRAERFRQ